MQHGMTRMQQNWVPAPGARPPGPPRARARGGPWLSRSTALHAPTSRCPTRAHATCMRPTPAPPLQAFNANRAELMKKFNVPAIQHLFINSDVIGISHYAPMPAKVRTQWQGAAGGSREQQGGRAERRQGGRALGCTKAGRQGRCWLPTRPHPDAPAGPEAGCI